MTTVRFAQVVEKAGKPDVHLLLTDPRLDPVLQRAVKTGRVMTLHQIAVGNKADFGTVGLVDGAKGQILIFPRSLAPFEGKSVVGIKYDLLAEEPVGRTKPSLQTTKPKPAPRTLSRAKAKKIVPFPHPIVEDEDERIVIVKNQIGRALKALAEGKQVTAHNLLRSVLRTLN